MRITPVFRCFLAMGAAGQLVAPALPVFAAETNAAAQPVAAALLEEGRDFEAIGENLPASLQSISAADPRFRYQGRFDRSDPAGPVDVWQGSRIGIDFGGDRLALRFDGVEGQSYFDVQVDGTNYLLGVRRAGPQTFLLRGPLNAGRHHLSLFKRSEAAAGCARFLGIGVVTATNAWSPAAPAHRLAMEFIGDSITVGACNEDGPRDQWEDRVTHNNALSYAALTAEAFSADYRNIAVSGMGVVTGWVAFRASQIWNRLYPRPDSPPADLSLWRPDVIFVNLGENDDSYSRAKGYAFPATFSADYVSLVRAVRSAYPEAEIVLLRGGMYGGARSTPLRQAWDRAVAQLQAEDRRITHFAFAHWTRNHPRVADDRAMADELIAWLRRQSFMTNGKP
jgi:lysophospholipase L1-like esterase